MLQGLQAYNRLYEKQRLEPQPIKKKGSYVLERDEMWSFQSLKIKVWIWIALDRNSLEVLGRTFGKRDAEGARVLWDSLPAVYR